MVVQLSLADDCVLREQRLLRYHLGRIRDVRIDPSGVLYVLTDGAEGMLYRVELPHGGMRGGGKGPF
jgi:aldose sugar dehydrogenase